MIADAAMYRKALRVLTALESKAKSGDAIPAERERLEVVRDHVLIWEWAHDDRPAAEVMPPLPEPAPPARHPLALRFCDWYARVCDSPKWRGAFWYYAAVHWWGEKPTEGRGAILLDMEAEMEARGLHDWQREERAA